MTKLEKIKLLLKLTATDITAPENSETLRDKINNAVDHMLASKILPRFDEIVEKYAKAQMRAYSLYSDRELDFLIKVNGSKFGESLAQTEKRVNELIFKLYADIAKEEVARAEAELADEGGYGLSSPGIYETDDDGDEEPGLYGATGFTIMDDLGDDDDDDDDDFEDPDSEEFKAKYGL